MPCRAFLETHGASCAQEYGRRHTPKSPAELSPSWRSPIGSIAGFNGTTSICAFGDLVGSSETCTCAQTQCLICEQFSICRKCEPGYLLEGGKCLPRWMGRRSRSREKYGGDSTFYTFFKFLFLFMVMLPCLVLYALRNMQRRARAGPSEISMYNMPPLMVATAGTDRYHRNIDAQDAGDGESESTALLAPGGDRAKPSNAVLVVGPMGSIEVGVEQDLEEGEGGEDSGQIMGLASDESHVGRSLPAPNAGS
eukprot:evm.model.scf_2322.2 EVM.evm.TU.scf_2322.2   scf_2322:10629-12372(+)